MIAGTIARLLPADAGDQAFLKPFVRPELRNWNEKSVGSIRPTDALSTGVF
jgi:hypothetical protein